MATQSPIDLIIIHYHLRSGGVRRVIEQTLPAILQTDRKVDRVVFATGEIPDDDWWDFMLARCQPARLCFVVHSCIGYYNELQASPLSIRTELRGVLANLLENDSPRLKVVWAHNLGLARNVILADELKRACEKSQTILISHQHDLWVENRWGRWREAIQSGYDTPAKIAAAVFPIAPNIGHVTINSKDHQCFQQHLSNRAFWMPNAIRQPDPISEDQITHAKNWLSEKAALREGATKAQLLHTKKWILPCRILRRKNIAEALLICRWIDETAVLLTTSGVSSNEERHYATRLESTAKKYLWPLHLGILHQSDRLSPKLNAILLASDMLCFTSLQEGFGLPYLEAHALQRPLLCRSLPNIMPDLQAHGLYFPYAYDDINIPYDLFDIVHEQKHQHEIWKSWIERLPHPFRKYASPPQLIHDQRAKIRKPHIPFSRLSQTAQLQVLANEPKASWHASADCNPSFAKIRKQLHHEKPLYSSCATSPNNLFSTDSYAKQFWRIVDTLRVPCNKFSGTSHALQETLVRYKLSPQNTYPILMAPET